MLARKTVQILLYSYKASDFLALISGDMLKNIQDSTTALENCRNP